MEVQIKEGQKFAQKYQIIELLGEGATSKVYLAYDSMSEMNVSLKILKNETINDKKIRNFEREAKAISLLNDDNIIKIYEINLYENFHYIAQEYVEGITLKDYIKNTNKIHVKDVVDILGQILSGLEHAHNRKVIHKDIKSQNILLGVDKKIKITDFGIADILEDESAKTQSLMGTPQYVAPEVLSRQGATEQTDIYSVGILMYELLMGHAPFTGEKSTIIMMKQLNQPLPSVIKERSDIPQSMENILIKSTAKKLINRYKTAAEMKLDIETCLNISRRNEMPEVLLNDFDEKTEHTLDLSGIKPLEQKQKNKKKSRTIIFSVLIAILIAIIISMIFTGNTEAQTMPDITNKDIDTAKLILNNLGFDESQIKIEYKKNNDVPSGTVIQTEPKKNEELSKKSIIKITVSKGPELFKLEDYIGLSESVATNQLEELGLGVNITYVNSEESSGKVIKQDPIQGKEVKYGDTINLTVSQGLKVIYVPNFKDLTETEANDWADENNINLSKTKVCNNDYDKDHIFEQNPKYNAQIEEKDSIELTISTGNCETSSSSSNNISSEKNASSATSSETKND